MNIFLNSTDNIDDKLCFININNKKHNMNNIYLLYSDINISNNFINIINKSNIIKTNMFDNYNLIYSNDNINLLINNIYNNKFNSKLLEKYNLNYNNYSNINKNKLNKLINSIEKLVLTIKKHIGLYEDNITYIDIINKSIKQYFEINKKKIIDKLLLKLEVFYILSIIFNNNNNNVYMLYYNIDIVTNIKLYI